MEDIEYEIIIIDNLNIHLGTIYKNRENNLTDLFDKAEEFIPDLDRLRYSITVFGLVSVTE